MSIFENERTPDVITRTNTYSQHSQFKYSVDDSWDVNKIKILDDLAFVAEDEYTDIEKQKMIYKNLLSLNIEIKRYK